MALRLLFYLSILIFIIYCIHAESPLQRVPLIVLANRDDLRLKDQSDRVININEVYRNAALFPQHTSGGKVIIMIDPQIKKGNIQVRYAALSNLNILLNKRWEFTSSKPIEGTVYPMTHVKYIRDLHIALNFVQSSSYSYAVFDLEEVKEKINPVTAIQQLYNATKDNPLMMVLTGESPTEISYRKATPQRILYEKEPVHVKTYEFQSIILVLFFLTAVILTVLCFLDIDPPYVFYEKPLFIGKEF